MASYTDPKKRRAAFSTSPMENSATGCVFGIRVPSPAAPQVDEKGLAAFEGLCLMELSTLSEEDQQKCVEELATCRSLNSVPGLGDLLGGVSECTNIRCPKPVFGCVHDYLAS